MVQELWFSFKKCFSPFTMLLVEGSSKTGLLDICLTTSLVVRKFKNTSALSVNFLSEICKIESKFRKCKKKFRH